MNALIKNIGWLVVGFLFMTEAHSLLDAVRPDIAQTKIDVFLSPSFHMELSVQWYMKMIFDSLFLIVLSFVCAKIAIRYSYKLFLISWVLFGYFCFDLLSFIWNYKSSFSSYWAVLAICITCIIILMYPRKKREGIYKVMD